MDLFLLGAGMGIVGGLIPAPLHMIALSQVALRRWVRAVAILVGPPLLVDGALLVLIFFFYQYVPHNVSRYLAYVGGVALVAYGAYAIAESRRKAQEELARSAGLTYAGVTVGTLSQLAAPGTWIYWLTLAGPILAEGRQKGLWHVAPFFVGSVAGFYGGAIFSVWLMAWGASLHRQIRPRLFLASNVLLVVLGVSYLLRARFVQ